MTIQSGILSAFGMAPETKFRKVPVTAEQVGIATTNPHRFWTIEPDGGFPATPDIWAANDEIDGSASRRRTILTAKDYDGRQSFKADGENLDIPLLGVYGTVTETQVFNGTVTPLVDVYKKVYVQGGKKPSFTAEEIFGLGNYGRLSSGVIIPRLDMTFGRMIMASINAVPYRQIPNRYIKNDGNDEDYNWTDDLANVLPAAMQDGTEGVQAHITAAPTLIDVVPDACGDGPFVHARIVKGTETGFEDTFFKLNGITDLDFMVPEGFSINQYFDYESHHIMGSGYDPGATNSNAFNVEGRLDVLFEDNDLILNTLAHCYFGLNFKVQGILIGNSGIRYSLEYHIPRFRFLNSDTVTPARAMMTGGNWVAELDPEFGYEAKVTLINTTKVSDWAGEESSDPGGLGGYTLSA